MSGFPIYLRSCPYNTWALLFKCKTVNNNLLCSPTCISLYAEVVRHEFNHLLNVAYIDITAAFDLVDHHDSWKVLTQLFESVMVGNCLRGLNNIRSKTRLCSRSVLSVSLSTGFQTARVQISALETAEYGTVHDVSWN